MEGFIFSSIWCSIIVLLITLYNTVKAPCNPLDHKAQEIISLSEIPPLKIKKTKKRLTKRRRPISTSKVSVPASHLSARKATPHHKNLRRVLYFGNACPHTSIPNKCSLFGNIKYKADEFEEHLFQPLNITDLEY